MAKPGTVPPKARRRFSWLKWVGAVALLALLIGEGIYLWPRLSDSWKSLTEIHWGWVAAAIWLQALSLSGFGRLQKQLLRTAGVHVSQRRSLSVIYAATAMSVTLPAGQVFSTAFTYRETRRWGANPLVASWQLAISGVIAAGGLALLGVGGALAVGSSVNPYTLIFSIGGAVALIYLASYASRHPDSVHRFVSWIVTRANKIRKRPADTGIQRVREVIDQLESVRLRPLDLALTGVWAFVHRAADIACLAFCCYAIGAEPRMAGLIIAFAIGKAVGSIPLAPGGIVYVDATLIATLTSAAGVTAAQAVAVAFVYRVVSFILVAIVGWIVFLFLFRKRQKNDTEYADEIDQLRHES